MQLKATAKTILNQIFDLTQQLTDNKYRNEIALLNGNTIGKHVRHIIEFFDLLLIGANQGVVNYDKRKHAKKYETDTQATLSRIREIILEVDNMDLNCEVNLEVSYSKSEIETVNIKSSLERELAYNIEHAIHHMAIIKIAIQTVYPNILLSNDFGVAYSTVRYQKSSEN